MAKRGKKSHASRMRRIQEIYDQLPTVDCKKMCSASCGCIDMSDVEAERFRHSGVELPMMTHTTCPSLGPMGTCTSYEIRPMICRLWGITEGMPCPYGCAVDPAPLPDRVALPLLAEVMEIGGAEGRARNWRQLVETAMDMPEGKAFFDTLIARGREGDRRRMLDG